MKRLGKQVQFHGVDLWITMPYVAVDECGDIREHANKPVSEGSFWWCGSNYNELGKVDLQGMDFKETLLRFDL